MQCFFYLSCGFSLDVSYESISCVNSIQEEGDDDLQAHITVYNTDPTFEGCMLRKVVEQMHPELLN